MTIHKIRFDNREWIIINNAITTEERYRNGLVSYAHWFPDGTIKRHGRVIGTVNDIEWLAEKEEIRPTKKGIAKLFIRMRNWYR